MEGKQKHVGLYTLNTKGEKTERKISLKQSLTKRPPPLPPPDEMSARKVHFLRETNALSCLLSFFLFWSSSLRKEKERKENLNSLSVVVSPRGTF